MSWQFDPRFGWRNVGLESPEERFRAAYLGSPEERLRSAVSSPNPAYLGSPEENYFGNRSPWPWMRAGQSWQTPPGYALQGYYGGYGAIGDPNTRPGYYGGIGDPNTLPGYYHPAWGWVPRQVGFFGPIIQHVKR